MTVLSTGDILTALSNVRDEDAGADVVSAGLISGVTVRGAKVGFLITIDPRDKERKAHLRERCERAVKALAGVESVTAVMTAQNAEPIPPAPESGYAAPRERAVWNVTPVAHVGRVIAVASGKGGVGKSTCAVGLARALAAQGERVGLLDADIYGPSLPRMLGLMGQGQPELESGMMIPPRSGDIACMSMQFITGEQAAILRGPMISKALHQMIRFTKWGTQDVPLDTLVIDMPPGTGDIHLSLVQQVPLAGAIIITTPQEVAVMDARKSAQMFQKVGVKLLGVMENMSGEIFGQGGGEALAKEMGTRFLGYVPLDATIRKGGDAGDMKLHPAFVAAAFHFKKII